MLSFEIHIFIYYVQQRFFKYFFILSTNNVIWSCWFRREIVVLYQMWNLGESSEVFKGKMFIFCNSIWEVKEYHIHWNVCEMNRSFDMFNRIEKSAIAHPLSILKWNWPFCVYHHARLIRQSNVYLATISMTNCF